MWVTDVAQPSEQCRMTLKNGQRCRYPSKYNGLCGLHWRQVPKSNRQTITRRALIFGPAFIYYLSGSINNSFQIYDHLRPKPPVTSVARVVNLSVEITGVATMSAVGTLTASKTVTAQGAPMESASFTAAAAVPIDVRRAAWQMRVHPKRLAEVAAGRLRWNQLRFPKAPTRWAI